MAMRADGHPYRYGKKKNELADCLHWCLPGPIDSWNEFLIHLLEGDLERPGPQATTLSYEMTRRLSRQHSTEGRLRRDIQRQFREIEELRQELRQEKERSQAMEARLHKEACDRWRDGFETCRGIV
ncbi:hypothetical protein U1Q18_038831 [Sarracenia purpurea var. burkii]